jgi:gluconate kinase
MNWPEWWFWDVEITPHIEKRMLQRDFNEIELRQMLHSAKYFEKDIVDGRFKILTDFKKNEWEIIVDPDYEENLLVIITAYSTEE